MQRFIPLPLAGAIAMTKSVSPASAGETFHALRIPGKWAQKLRIMKGNDR